MPSIDRPSYRPLCRLSIDPHIDLDAVYRVASLDTNPTLETLNSHPSTLHLELDDPKLETQDPQSPTLHPKLKTNIAETLDPKR